MRVLVVNAGSTSVKLRLVDEFDRVARSENLGAPGPSLAQDVDAFLESAGPVDVVGHRVVHGGPDFDRPVVLDDAVRERLTELSDLAPLHNPPALAAIDALCTASPDVPVVACFDTAFHHWLPEEARRYALPPEWVSRWGVRRYGFHGLSCEWSLGRAASMLGRPAADLRLAVCHLGGGQSVTAIAGGRSVDTTMGFTPTEGLVMATRSGDVDPGAVAFLASRGLSGPELMDGLEHRSGLLGLTDGRTGDMKVVLADRAAGDQVAAGAVAMYLHRLRGAIARMATACRGLDALIFTAGIGERSAEIRAEACAGLGWMGVAVDPSLNMAVGEDDVEITAPGSGVRVLVIHAREELVVARHCRGLLDGSPDGTG